MTYYEKTLESDSIYIGRIIDVKKDKVELVNGNTSYREVVIHQGGVAIVPLSEDGQVYCVRQFRYPYSKELLELPAGKLEKGEEPLHCAIRELEEETGFKAEEMIDLGYCYPSPGYCKEELYSYLARGLERGQQHLDQDEFLNVEKYSISALKDMIMEDKIHDAKTIIGIFKTLKYLEGK